jgi:hypothetical protein
VADMIESRRRLKRVQAETDSSDDDDEPPVLLDGGERPHIPHHPLDDSSPPEGTVPTVDTAPLVPPFPAVQGQGVNPTALPAGTVLTPGTSPEAQPPTDEVVDLTIETAMKLLREMEPHAVRHPPAGAPARRGPNVFTGWTCPPAHSSAFGTTWAKP